MATKITTRVLADDAVTDAKIADVTLTTATQSASDNTTKIATTAYVTTAIANLADSAPSTLNTLNELAAALGDDANYATTTTNAIAGKLPLAGGTMTGALTVNSNIKAELSSTAWAGEFKQTNTSNGDGVHIRIGSSAAADYGLRVDTNAGNIAGFVVKGDGNVGIGTFTPNSPLVIQASHQLTDVTGMSANSTLVVGNTGSGNNVYNAIHLSGNQQSMFIASINHGTEANRRLGFFLGSAAGDAVADERLTITAGGKVGIGTSSPDYQIHVKGDGHQRIKVEKTDAGGDADISIANRSDGTGWVLFTDAQAGSNSGVIKYVHNGDYMSFRTNGTDDRIRITSNGNVGIGTGSPTTTLQVNASGGGNFLVSRTGSAGGLYIESDGTNGVVRNPANSPLLFQTNGANTRMRILGDGRVGINRTPSKSNSKLEVGGADNVGLIHVEASGNFASWGIGSNQSKFYYNDSQKMGLTNEGVMRLMGGVTQGRQDIVFNNSYMQIANNATYTLTDVLNTGALISIGANRSNQGVTYDHCLIFAETGTAATVVANPSGRIAINSATTASKVNVFVNGGHIVIQNKVASTVQITIAAFVFQGN